MTSILGISAFYHDSAAAILVDGKIIAAAQEERFTRKKHDSSYPFNSVQFVLKYSNLNLKKEFKIIGSAHNISEIKIKEKQNCEYIFLSPLFKTNKHKYYLNVVKFKVIIGERFC